MGTAAVLENRGTSPAGDLGGDRTFAGPPHGDADASQFAEALTHDLITGWLARSIFDWLVLRGRAHGNGGSFLGSAKQRRWKFGVLSPRSQYLADAFVGLTRTHASCVVLGTWLSNEAPESVPRDLLTPPPVVSVPSGDPLGGSAACRGSSPTTAFDAEDRSRGL